MISAYWAMYGTETTILLALMLGLTIGLWQGYELGKEHRFKRDSRGRFVR